MTSDTSKTSKIVKLSLFAQNYAWGKPPSTSKVAQLLKKTNDPNNTPYAELWMGTHKNGPSSVIYFNGSTQLLSEYLGHELPYLFKVLSVNRSLSIQAHPNKALAEKLHLERPTIYRDDNHKPEMATALTTFEVMCGFRPASEICQYLQSIPEFSFIVGKDIAQEFIDCSLNSKDTSACLKKVFSSVMKADKKFIHQQIDILIARLKENELNENKNENEFQRDLDVNELVLRLNDQFPGDVGIFAVFMLNCFRLQPGESIFLDANFPHAYLDGDCLECMACSDNVVRAGLTPKLRDIDVLCSMLNYYSSKPNIMNGEKIGKFTVQYAPNTKEFRLDCTVLGVNEECFALENVWKQCLSEYASIALVYSGEGFVNGMRVENGDCLLIPKDVHQLVVKCTSKGQKLSIARCFAPTF